MSKSSTISRRPANVAAAVSYEPINRRATLNPDVDLEAGATYVATLTTGATDVSGNQLDQDPAASGNQQKVWYFTTGGP